MKALRTPLILLVILILILLYSSFFIVNEGQASILLRLGKLVAEPSTGKVLIFHPGIHSKLPFIEKVRYFDVRLQTLGIQSSRIVTAEKKDVIVDFYVKWKVNDIPLYFTRTGGNEQQAGILLQQQLNDALRAEFGKRTISEVVSDDRSKIMADLLQAANATAKGLGLLVIDVRIKRIDLPNEVSAAIYDRMRAERERVATEHRSMGRATAEAIRANADANVTIILATAAAQAASLRAEGDSQAAHIYTESYSQDPEFYNFYRSILAYQESFNDKRDILILKPDNNQFFKYFNSIFGGKPQNP